jgi:hypothetical protein
VVVENKQGIDHVTIHHLLMVVPTALGLVMIQRHVKVSIKKIINEKIKIKHDDFRSLNRFDHKFKHVLIVSNHF